MKVIVNESLGLEYAWDVISSCDQNGMQAIADNQNNEILFYRKQRPFFQAYYVVIR